VFLKGLFHEIPLKYTLRNFKSRRLTTAITMTGIALVVFVFAAVLMLAHGIQKTLVATGMPDNVIIARKAAMEKSPASLDVMI